MLCDFNLPIHIKRLGLTNLGDYTKAEFMYKTKPKAQKQFELVDRDQIRFAVILGPEELKSGHVRIKEQVGKESNLAAHDKSGVVVERSEMISLLKERLYNPS